MNRAGTLLLLVVVGCGSQDPRVAHPDDGEPGNRRTAPPRAIPVVELRNDDSRLVTFRIAFDAGSADDPAGKEGLTSLAARLVAEGGTRELDYSTLVARLFPLAGEISVSVDRDQTVFVGRVHRDKLEPFYELFHDVLLEPRMGEEDFRRLREDARSALTLELRGNDDEELGKEVLQANVFPGHPYGHPTLGTEAALGAITLEDVRAHRAAVLCRDRATLGLAGGYPPDFAAKVLGDLASLPAPCAAREALPEPARPAGVQVVIVDKPDAASTAISIGFPIGLDRTDDDFPALALATSYLGQHRQFAGVLFQKMRADRGLNYGDYAYPEHFEQDGWSRFARPNVSRRQQYFSIWIRPVEPQNAHFALRAAIRELARLSTDGLSEDAVGRMRTFLDRYVGLFEMTESRRLGNRIDDLFYGFDAFGQTHLERLRDGFRTLDAAKIRRVVREHLGAQNLRVAIVHKDARTLAEALSSDAPSPITYREEKPQAILDEDREIQAYPLRIARDAIRIVPVAEVFK